MTHPPSPADIDPHRASRNRSIRALTQDTARQQPSITHASHYTQDPSLLTSPYEVERLSPSARPHPSPRITIEKTSPNEEHRPSRSTRGPVRATSPGNMEVEASSAPQLPSSQNIRTPRIQETNEVRSRIPHAKPSRSTSGTPKSAMRAPSTLATPRNARSPHSPGLAKIASSPRSPLNSNSELEREYERTMTSESLKVMNVSSPSTSSDSGESEREREQWRQRSNAWGRSRRLEDQKSKAGPILSGSSSRIPSRNRSGSRTRQHVGLGLHVDDRDGLQERDLRVPRGNGDEHTHMDIQGDNAQITREPTSRDHQGLQRQKSTFRENLRRREALVSVADGFPVRSRYQASPSSVSKNDNVTTIESMRRDGPREQRQVWEEEDSVTDVSVEESTQSLHRRKREIPQSHTPNQYRQQSRGQREDITNHSSRRNRRSSSVPAVVLPSLVDNPLLLPPRPEKSVRFQQGDQEPYASDEDFVGRVRRTRHRTSTGIEVAQRSRRSSNDVDTAPNHRSFTETDQKQTIIVGGRRSKEFSSRREREAFGIPHSLSYTGKDDGNLSSSSHQDLGFDGDVYDAQSGYPAGTCLPHAESNLSFVDEGSWQSRVDADDFSRGAESLFRSLSDNAPTEESQQRHRSRGGRQSPDRREFSANAAFEHAGGQEQAYVTESFSTPSVYDDEPLDQVEAHPASYNQEDPILQSVMHPRIYNDLLTKHGPMEMRRQDVIFDLSSSEAAFVRCLRSTVRRFILPLRQKDSKTWVLGVPESVSRLFDWLEDIVNLHVALGEALVACGDLWKAGDIVKQVAETIRAFVPRFEVYQPYLMRVNHVGGLLSQATNSPEDQLGEFFRMRGHESARDGRSIVDLLQEPVRRLEKYPELFEKLLEFTPRTHTDYLASLSLLHSTRMTIQVLYEVKTRETEYEHAKGVLADIIGVPYSVVAQRERRLLWEGTVKLESSVSQSSRRVGRQDESAPPKVSFEMVKMRLVVFTDMIILAASEPRSKRTARGRHENWRVLETLGMSRILRLDEKSQSISLDLLPLNPDDVRTGVISETSSSQSLELVIPSSWSADERSRALAALRRCHKYAIRSLSFPSHSGKYLSHGLQVDLEQDTKQSVMAIISTGLPLPKSPSVQMADVRSGHGSDIVEQEREERGWWSLRFQQIMREMQRQNIDQTESMS
ncbi:hypothetical protein QCA50_015170 [Cerrena zonata]|uniref:DH domain-containing protein n=1 Tax=Cerrena zonata TaxID=2478898 RepID=A0AAW0FL00_9APHY